MKHGKRPFFIVAGVFIITIALMFLFAPPTLLAALTPAISLKNHYPALNLIEAGNIDLGRQDVLVHINSQKQGVVSVQQYVHYYFREETAVVNFKQNLTGNPDWFFDEPESYQIALPVPHNNQLLLCNSLDTTLFVCEYRAQMGHWTLHTDFVSRDTAVYDQQFFLDFLNKQRLSRK